MADYSEHGRLSWGIKRLLVRIRFRTQELGEYAEWTLGKKAARLLGALVLVAVVVGVLLALLDWYIAPRGPEQKQAVVVTLAQILGGAALLSGLYFTWRTLQVNREGQITDRYTRAVDQLGKTDDDGNRLFEIRVGGIYALERIARQSEEDHGPIMEVLTAYVRQHAPWPPQKHQEGKNDEASARSLEEDSGLTNGDVLVKATAPDPDIQAIATVLGRRTRDFLHGEDRLDLYNTNLSGADLSGANLEGANLSSKDPDAERVYGVDFSDVSEGANLSGAKLVRTNLAGADLTGAIITQAQLEDALGDEHTRLPPHRKRPAHWGVQAVEQLEED